MSQDDMWDELPPKPKQENTLETFLKKWIPEANPPQRKLLTDYVEELIKEARIDCLDEVWREMGELFKPDPDKNLKLWQYWKSIESDIVESSIEPDPEREDKWQTAADFGDGANAEDVLAELERPIDRKPIDRKKLQELAHSIRKDMEEPKYCTKEEVLEIIGDDIDTQALVQAKEREQAKHAFTVNETKEAQRIRLCEAFGIEIPKMNQRELREWLKELR